MRVTTCQPELFFKALFIKIVHLVIGANSSANECVDDGRGDSPRFLQLTPRRARHTRRWQQIKRWLTANQREENVFPCDKERWLRSFA